MSHIVHIPSPLRSLTGGAARASAAGTDILSVLENLDPGYPGMRERIADDRCRLRSNVRMFIGAREVRELAEAVCITRGVPLIPAAKSV